MISIFSIRTSYLLLCTVQAGLTWVEIRLDLFLVYLVQDRPDLQTIDWRNLPMYPQSILYHRSTDCRREKKVQCYKSLNCKNILSEIILIIIILRIVIFHLYLFSEKLDIFRKWIRKNHYVKISP